MKTTTSPNREELLGQMRRARDPLEELEIHAKLKEDERRRAELARASRKAVEAARRPRQPQGL
jgi:hypothetical protein